MHEVSTTAFKSCVLFYVCHNGNPKAQLWASNVLSVTLTAGIFKHVHNNFRSNHAAHTTAKRTFQQQNSNSPSLKFQSIISSPLIRAEFHSLGGVCFFKLTTQFGCLIVRTAYQLKIAQNGLLRPIYSYSFRNNSSTDPHLYTAALLRYFVLTISLYMHREYLDSYWKAAWKDNYSTNKNEHRLLQIL